VSPPLHEFDGFRLDPQQRMLFALPGGAAVDLQPRVFDALLYFVERPGELLGKRELMQALWPSAVVEENSLNQIVSQLRKALGERPAEHRFIVTSPGRGYRFVAAVRTVQRDAVSLPAPHPLSLAVLPFVDGRQAAGSLPLGDAVAADLIRLLGARSRLRVTAHSSSAALAAQLRDAQRIAGELQVSRIVTGEITGDARQLQVTARLQDAASGAHLWSCTLQRPMSGLAELQGDLARNLAQIVDPESTRPPVTAPTVAPDAYLAYLRALSLSQNPSANAVESSIALLRQAIAQSPTFSRAHSLLAIQCTTSVMFGFAQPDALELARQEVATALAQDDQNGETYCAAGVIDCLGGNWCRAEERFRIAHSLTADALVSGLRCAYLTLSAGQLQRALQQAEYALQLAPTHPIGIQMLATLHQALGHDAQALRYARVAVELGQSPSIAPLADLLAQLSRRCGDHAAAISCTRAVVPARLLAPALDALFEALCSPVENTAQAVGLLAGLQSALRPDELDPPMRKRLLLWQTQLGALDAAYALAFDSLDHYARDGTVGGAWGVLWIPEMLRFREDERFQRFARRLRLFDYWLEYGPPDGYSLAGERLLPIG
jgi:DNA-binding winged helix-turn-helix (wHTH) protein/tetratricopeptide (TPR) repeat protein